MGLGGVEVRWERWKRQVAVGLARYSFPMLGSRDGSGMSVTALLLSATCSESKSSTYTSHIIQLSLACTVRTLLLGNRFRNRRATDSYRILPVPNAT